MLWVQSMWMNLFSSRIGISTVTTFGWLRSISAAVFTVFSQRLGTDRVTDCFGSSGNNVLADAGFIAVNIIYNALLGEQYLFLSFAYWQKVLFHRHPSI